MTAQLHVRETGGRRVVRVWCVAPGCRWATYRALMVRRELVPAGGNAVVLEQPREATVEELTAGACPRCEQASLRVYPPPPHAHLDGEQHPLPGMPRHADDQLQRVNGRQLQLQRRLEQTAAYRQRRR